MNQIQNPANDNYTFGYEFDYAVWTADSEITLTNVPWNNDYRDVWGADSTNDLNKYINSQGIQNAILRSTYAKVNEPIYLDMPFNVVNQYNYVRVFNPAQPLRPNIDTAKYFYYFIVDVKYIAPNNTQITVQLDVFQTYIRQIQFGRCYIERGHLGIANEDQFRNNGQDYLTVPEGLDVGSEMIPITSRGESQVMITGGNKYSILVASVLKLEATPGTIKAPNRTAAEGGQFQSLPSGASYYIFATPTDFLAFMKKYSTTPWVTEGIISITAIPPYTRYWTSAQMGAKLPIGAYKAPSFNYGSKTRDLFPNWRTSAEIVNYIPPRYRHLKKFFTFPYMAIKATTFSGHATILKPEQWNADNAPIVEEASFLPPGQRLQWWPIGYQGRSKAVAPYSKQFGPGLDYAVYQSAFPTMAIVNDGAINFMASNARSLQFGFQSADWSQQKALRGNQVSYDQASRGIEASGAQAGIANNAATNSVGISQQLAQDNFVVDAITGIGGATIGGAGAGPAGMIAGGTLAAGSTIAHGFKMNNQFGAQNANLANEINARNASQGVSAGLAGYIRDSNKALGDYAARGDYENEIAGLNAKIQDAQMTPPSMAGQAGGETLGMVNFRWGYWYYWMMPSQAYIQSIGEYWLRYGYAVQRFAQIPPSLQVMDKFTYWKMKETYIRAARLPEWVKQAVRGMFEKGITVWANPDDIGVIDPALNKALPGITIDGYVPPEPEPEPTPEPPAKKRKKRNMLVYSTVDETTGFPVNTWALAGASPGTDANWQETTDIDLANMYLTACDVETPVGIPYTDFVMLRDQFRGPVSTLESQVTPG